MKKKWSERSRGCTKPSQFCFFLFQITYKHTQGGDSHENQIKDPLAKVEKETMSNIVHDQEVEECLEDLLKKVVENIGVEEEEGEEEEKEKEEKEENDKNEEFNQQ
ncbi:hypothetical protein CRE_13670 [Caenorhabditis remanei]|uniref:Uncharacterized protein n=1 Tax=Caenorhabditis remanei TaxID=31234 RepID=E3N7K5_CAERE|nr:hypothetical protein CRE_13670 [Caenorhabditis remanei]